MGAGPAAGGCQVEGGMKQGAGCRGGTWQLVVRRGICRSRGAHAIWLSPECPRMTMGTALYVPLGAGFARQPFRDKCRELGKPLDPRPQLTN